MVHNTKLKHLGSSALMLKGRRRKEEDVIKALSEGKGCELQYNENLNRKDLNPFHLLTGLFRWEAGGKSKIGGETAKCYVSLEGLSAQQKTQVPFVLEERLYFYRLSHWCL